MGTFTGKAVTLPGEFEDAREEWGSIMKGKLAKKRR